MPFTDRKASDRDIQNILDGWREVEIIGEGKGQKSAKINALQAFREQHRIVGRGRVSRPLLLSRTPPTRTVTGPVTQPDGQVIIVATEVDITDAPAEEWTEKWLFTIRYKE